MRASPDDVSDRLGILLSLIAGEDLLQCSFRLVTGPGPPGVFCKFGAFGCRDGGFRVDAGPADEDEVVEVIGSIGAVLIATPKFLYVLRACIEKRKRKSVVEFGGRDFRE